MFEALVQELTLYYSCERRKREEEELGDRHREGSGPLCDGKKGNLTYSSLKKSLRVWETIILDHCKLLFSLIKLQWPL